MDSSPLDILSWFPGRRILIVGDVMLDEYLWGTVRRISPEAPVPVVELHQRSYVPGGAANAAANVVGLRGEVELIGLIGADEAGRRLQQALAALGIGLQGVVVAANRPTTTKTRIIAHSQQVVRVDQEHREVVAGSLEDQLLGLIDDQLPEVDACLLSDYAKGIVSPALAQHLIQRGRALGKPVVVDPKGSDFVKYRQATLIKPNQHEASLFFKRDLSSEKDVFDAGRQLLARLDGGGVLITRGAAGMSLFEPGRDTVHVPAEAREVFDVTGAGDTVASTLALALAAQASLEQAARLASRAAAIIVGRVGTTAIQYEDLLDDER
jgi:D-beta-D-heptose 7-phosphate kinase/D-beta-D-heptose 1-phosphate adenosyltransferase